MPSRPLKGLEKLIATGLPEDERLRLVLNQAVDEALRAYLVNQFSVMMKDPTPGQPERARAGMEKSIAAWRKIVRMLGKEEADE